jgi:hypothetical protein
MTGTACEVDLWPVLRVAAPSQLAVGRGDADLEVGHGLAGAPVLADWRAFGSGGCSGRRVLDERVPVRRWPRGGACQQFSEIMGVRHASSQVVRPSGPVEPMVPVRLV